MANKINFGKIYDTTWFGTPIKNGWGGIYYELSTAEITLLFEVRVLADGGFLEGLNCLNTITKELI